MTLPAWTFANLDETPSTQDLAIAAARAGAHRHGVIAARQSAGRGRGGRPWVAPVGNLNLSLALRPAPQPLQPGAWSLLAGVALHDSVAAHLPDASAIKLKWPNDLLLHGAKLAGILVDSSVDARGLLDWVVIGIGVNIVAAPPLPDRPTACLADAGMRLAPANLAQSITAALDHWLAEDFAAVRAAWLARAHPPGTRLRVQTANGLIEAAFSGLAEDGALLLDGGQCIASGEVGLI